MKVILLLTCCILSLIVDISDSRTPSQRPETNSECASGKIYATCFMRQKGDDDSREDSRGDDSDDADGGDDGTGDNGGDNGVGDGRDDGRDDDNRGSRNASRRGRDDDGNGNGNGDDNGDDNDGGIRGSVFFSQRVDENCMPTSDLKVRVRIRGLGGDDDDDNNRRGDDDNNRRGDDDNNGGEDCDDDGCRRRRLLSIQVHRYGDTRNKCLAAGPVYNPLRRDRPFADMGNVRSDRRGRINNNFRVADTSIVEIIGRSVVLHARQTGNSGARLACCVIGVADPKTKTVG